MNKLRLIAVAMVLQAAGGVDAAPSPEPIVTLSLSAAEVELGTLFYAYVEVSVGAGVDVSLPERIELGPAIEELGRQLTVSKRGELDLYTFELTLMSFELGEIEIPEIPIVYAAGEGAKEVRTATSRLKVSGTLADDARDLREVVPVSVIRRDTDRLYWAAGVAGGTLLLALVVTLLARAVPRMRVPPQVPALSALEVARVRFERLEASGSLDGDDRRSAYVEMSETVREYLSTALSISALDATTAEISVEIEAASISEDDRGELVRWLRDCDLVKFAGFRASEDDARAALYSARRWVERIDPLVSAAEEVSSGER